MSVEMIFEIGFNFCCRNFFANQQTSTDSLTLKLSVNFLNELTSVTENCVLEFFGEWAKVLSFSGPGMDMKILGSLPASSAVSWNDCVVVRNLSGADPVETRYVVSKISVVETHTDRPNRLIEFGPNRKIQDCRAVPVNPSDKPSNHLQFPPFWMEHTRRTVEKNPRIFRPLTTITSDVAVINAAVAFVANSPPGPYKFTHQTAPYVRTHVQVCDLSFRNLRLPAVRAGEDVPTYHLHVEIDEDVASTALPWLCAGDVLQVNTVKPVFAQKQAWNLYHKQKGFGETKIKIWSVLDGKVRDVHGNELQQVPEPPEIAELRLWMRERLLKDSLVGEAHQGALAGRDMWFSGRDLVARIERINRYTNSMFVTDMSRADEVVEVRVRSSQQNFADALNFIFTKLEESSNGGAFGQFVLLRNLRVNSADNTLFCSVEHITRVPDFCFDVQQMGSRQAAAVASQKESDVGNPEAEVEDSADEGFKSGFSFTQMIPTQWRDSLKLREGSSETQAGCVESSGGVAFEFINDEAASATQLPGVDANSQVEFEFVDEENDAKSPNLQDDFSQLMPRKLQLDTAAPPVAKRTRHDLS